MEDKEFSSVEEILDFFENNYQEDASTETQESTETAATETTTTETQETTEQKQQEEQTASDQPKEDGTAVKEEATEEQKSKVKHTKDEQQKFAFAKLNKERSDALAKAKEYEDIFNDLAKMYNFPDAESYKNQLRKAMDASNAKKQGISPEIYHKLQEQEAQINRLNAQNDMQIKQAKVNRFQKALDGVVKEYNFNQEDIDGMFDNLQKAGYTVDTLLQQPNPDLIIRGAFMSKINERTIQNQRELEAQSSKGVDTTKHDSHESTPDYDLDADVKATLKEYADSMGYKI